MSGSQFRAFNPQAILTMRNQERAAQPKKEKKPDLSMLRRQEASRHLPRAQKVLRNSGSRMILEQKSEFHYQLSIPGVWILKIYPGNCRLQYDKQQNSKPPFFRMRPPWNLLDVVREAVRLMDEGEA